MVEVTCLSDAELQNKLNTLGFPPGPILRTYAAIIRRYAVITCELTPKAENHL